MRSEEETDWMDTYLDPQGPDLDLETIKQVYPTIHDREQTAFFAALCRVPEDWLALGDIVSRVKPAGNSNEFFDYIRSQEGDLQFAYRTVYNIAPIGLIKYHVEKLLHDDDAMFNLLNVLFLSLVTEDRPQSFQKAILYCFQCDPALRLRFFKFHGALRCLDLNRSFLFGPKSYRERICNIEIPFEVMHVEPDDILKPIPIDPRIPYISEFEKQFDLSKVIQKFVPEFFYASTMLIAIAEERRPEGEKPGFGLRRFMAVLSELVEYGVDFNAPVDPGLNVVDRFRMFNVNSDTRKLLWHLAFACRSGKVSARLVQELVNNFPIELDLYDDAGFPLIQCILRGYFWGPGKEIAHGCPVTEEVDHRSYELVRVLQLPVLFPWLPSRHIQYPRTFRLAVREFELVNLRKRRQRSLFLYRDIRTVIYKRLSMMIAKEKEDELLLQHLRRLYPVTRGRLIKALIAANVDFLDVVGRTFPEIEKVILKSNVSFSSLVLATDPKREYDLRLLRLDLDLYVRRLLFTTPDEITIEMAKAILYADDHWHVNANDQVDIIRLLREYKEPLSEEEYRKYGIPREVCVDENPSPCKRRRTKDTE